MIGCTDLNIFRTFSGADKLRSFFRLLRCDRGLNAVVLYVHIGYFQATFTFVKVFSNFQIGTPVAKYLKFYLFSLVSYSLYIRDPLLLRA